MRVRVCGTVLVISFLGAAFAGESVMDDFETAPDTRWRFIADSVMGGVSSGGVAWLREGDVAFARLSGRVSTENNGGFLQIRREVEGGAPEAAVGVRLSARGNGQRYFVHLRTKDSVRPWYYFQAGFTVTEDWGEVRLPFDAFQPSRRFGDAHLLGDEVVSIAIVAYGRDHVAEVDVRNIGFYGPDLTQ